MNSLVKGHVYEYMFRDPRGIKRKCTLGLYKGEEPEAGIIRFKFFDTFVQQYTFSTLMKDITIIDITTPELLSEYTEIEDKYIARITVEKPPTPKKSIFMRLNI